MTTKHFIALADMIRHRRGVFTNEAIGILADFCFSQNNRFMRQRWLDYINGFCGPRGGSVKAPLNYSDPVAQP